MDTRVFDYQINKRENQLSIQQQELVEDKLQNQRKSKIVTWILWLVLGRWGAHRFYLHQHYAIGMLLLNVFGILLTFSIIGAIIGVPMLIAVIIWWVIDAFHLRDWQKKQDNILKNNIINNLTGQHIDYRYLAIPHPTTSNRAIVNNNYNFDPNTGHPINKKGIEIRKRLNQENQKPVGEHFSNSLAKSNSSNDKK